MSFRPKTPVGTIKLFRGDDTPTPAPLRDDVGDALELLHAAAGKPIAELGPEERAAYTAITQRVKRAIGTEDYQGLYDRATEVFKDIPSFRLGTVAAYFKGCAIETNLSQHGCSLQAVGALPRPGEDPCAHPVFLAEIHEGAYRFKALHTPRSGLSTTAYVFVPQGFQGFAQPERDWLARRVDAFHIYEINADGTEYTHVLNEPPRRTRALPLPGEVLAPTQASSSYVFWMAVIAVLLLIVILCLRMADIRFFA